MPLDVSSQRSRRWIVADLERLPDDGNRYEVVDGELLVTPAPSRYHQRAVTQLGVDLDARLLERWRPDDDRPEVAEAQLEWMPPGFDRPFVLDVADLFARVWRD